MPIVKYNTEVAAQVGIQPRRVTIISTDDYDTVTAAGYINNADYKLGLQLAPTDEVVMYYGANAANDLSGGSLAVFQPTFSAGVITLDSISSGGIDLPVIAAHLPMFADTEGTLEDSTIVAANVATAAANFTAGHLIGAGGANKTLADSGIVTANVVTAASNAAASGNIMLSGGANKTIADSGIAFKTGIDSWGGGGTTHVVSVPGVTASWSVFANIQNNTNPAYVNADTGTGQITLFFSADPGAGTQVSWLALSGSLALEDE